MSKPKNQFIIINYVFIIAYIKGKCYDFKCIRFTLQSFSDMSPYIFCMQKYVVMIW